MEKLIPLAQVEQLIDEMIADYFKSYENAQEEFVRVAFGNRIKSLDQLKSKLSFLPTHERSEVHGWIAVKDIEMLQRYDLRDEIPDYAEMEESDTGEYIRYESLKLLTKPPLQ